jgi:ABC-2 type transport system permease protein
MAMFQPQGQPKGDIGQLWQALGIRLRSGAGRPAMGQVGADPFIVWQDYNPHPKLELPGEFVFVDADMGGGGSAKMTGFNPDHPITSGLQEVLFPFPGAIAKDDTADVKWTPLVQTGERSGTIEVDQVMGNRGDMRQLRVFEKPGREAMVLAVAIERKGAAPPAASAQPDAKPAAGPNPIRAVVVADIDFLDGRIFGLRNRPDEVFGLDFDNVTFALNVLDDLAGDDRFLDIRKRKPRHRTLERIEDTVAEAREQADIERQKFITEFDEAEREANAAMQKEVGDFEKKIKEMETAGDADPQAAMQAVQQLASRQRLAQRRLDTKIEQLKRKRDAEVEAVERQLGSRVRQEQDRQKWLAVLLPPIPPLVVAFFVYFRRRALEREGVSKARLR